MSAYQGLISAHHIGGRDGSGTFKPVPRFAGDIHHVFYEADTDCTDQIERANQQEQVTVLPLCIGKAKGKREFNIDYDPFMSSLLEIDKDYSDYTLFTLDPIKGPMDYLIGDTGRTMEKRLLEMISLDDLYGAGSSPAPLPDFLSMDTQGGEYEILEGALQTLQSSVLAVRLEVEFQPIYKDQKLFGDLYGFMQSKGFRFVKFLEIHEMHPSREPLGLRAAGFDTFGEALFFREPQMLLAEADQAARYLKLLKLTFIAICFEQLAFALTCLRQLGPVPAELVSCLEGRTYAAFLAGLVERVEAHPKSFPPLFSQCYSFEQSRKRFDLDHGFATIEDGLAEMVTHLRRDVAERGGARLCVLPFGFHARKLLDLPDSGGAPLTFFDNSYEKHRASGFEVVSPEALGKDDYVLVLSPSYGPQLEEQVCRVRGEQPHRILNLDDLKTGRRAFDKQFQKTEVEVFLEEQGFEDLACRLYKTRIEQSR